jgi:hypothetical protein
VTIPRNWDVFSTENGTAGAEASITVAGVAGIAHVLTAVNVSATAYDASSPLAIYLLVVLESLPTGVEIELGFVSLVDFVGNGATPPAGPYLATGEFSWSGSLVYPIGTGFILTVYPGVATVTPYLELQGYDLR